jgi:hypothetical protein
LVVWLLIAGEMGCSGTGEPSGFSPECGEALGPDFATDQPWPETIRAWAEGRPADSLVHPDLQYRSAVTAADRALESACSGSAGPKFGAGT